MPCLKMLGTSVPAGSTERQTETSNHEEMNKITCSSAFSQMLLLLFFASLKRSMKGGQLESAFAAGIRLTETPTLRFFIPPPPWLTLELI